MVFVARQYELAIRVFLRRDDGESNLAWLDRVIGITQKASLRSTKVIKYLGVVRTRVRKGITGHSRRPPAEHMFELTEFVNCVSSGSGLESKYVLSQISSGDIESVSEF